MSRQDFIPERVIAKDFKKIADIVGRKKRIELEIVNSTKCTQCAYDPVTRASVDIKCVYCGGTGYTTVEKRVIINGFVSANEKEFSSIPAGINTSQHLAIYIDKNAYYLFKNWLQRKFRLRIDNEKYEIISKLDAGVFRNDFIKYGCRKVEGI